MSFGGCPDPRSTTEAPPLEQPAAITPAAAHDPGKPEVSRLPPAIERMDGRIVITTGALVEQILLVPRGIVWTESGEVRAAFADDDAPRTLAALVDPHGLATDGRTIYWMGDERNGRWDLASARARSLPSIAGPGEQDAFAFGDALYARSREGALWRLDGLADERVPVVVRLDFHPDPAWTILPGLAAAQRMLYLPAGERAAKGGRFFFVRFDPAGRTTTIPVQQAPRAFTWSVDATGDVVLLADDRGAVARIGARKRQASVLFEQPGVQLVCWCGADVCTFTADGDVASRRPGDATSRPVADDAHDPTMIACDRERVAWVSPLASASARITVVEL